MAKNIIREIEKWTIENVKMIRENAAWHAWHEFGMQYVCLEENDGSGIDVIICNSIDDLGYSIGLAFEDSIYTIDDSDNEDSIIRMIDYMLKCSFYSQLEDEIQNDYEYKTTHEDELNEIHDCLFDEYDKNEYECCWNDTYYRFDEEIENSGCVGEFETCISDELSRIFYDFDSDDRKEIDRHENVHPDYKRKSNLICYQATNGHYYIRKRG